MKEDKKVIQNFQSFDKSVSEKVKSHVRTCELLSQFIVPSGLYPAGVSGARNIDGTKLVLGKSFTSLK